MCAEKQESKEWEKQLAQVIRSPEALATYLELSESERAAFEAGNPRCQITPYYAKLLRDHPALRKTVVPDVAEYQKSPEEREDPLGEEAHRVAPHLIHTYPDKVLFLIASRCAVHCRYCTRSRLLGKSGPAADFSADLAYIRTHTEIRDVLLSGGDPLTLPTAELDKILSAIRSIPHIRTVRLGSKVPATLPDRITPDLCQMLRRYRVWLSLQFIHPAELRADCRSACRRLCDQGIPMVSQTVLLRGINDSETILADLFYGLLESGVKPYYLLQCDPVAGSSHFRTPVSQGIRLIQALHGRLSGLAVPQYVIDAPGGGGKVPILSEAQLQRKGDELLFLNYEGSVYRYPDPVPTD